MTKPGEGSGDQVDGVLVDLSLDPSAQRLTARPREVEVVFATSAGVLQTLEGPVAYQVGDALVSAGEGERWPIRRGPFESSYEPVLSSHGLDGSTSRYVKRPRAVWAKTCEAPTRVTLSGGRGTLTAQPGDWLVQYAPGELGVVAKALFPSLYQEVPRRPPARVRSQRQSGSVDFWLPVVLVLCLLALGILFLVEKERASASRPLVEFLASLSTSTSTSSIGRTVENVLDAMVLTLQALVLNVDPGEHQGVGLKLLLLAVPAVASLTVLLAFGGRIRAWWLWTRQRWGWPASELFLGGGGVVATLMDAARSRASVSSWFVLDHSSECMVRRNGESRFRSLDVRAESSLSIIADMLTGRGRWISCGLGGDVERVWIALGDDQLNLEVARRLLVLLHASAQKGRRTRTMMVHLSDHRMTRLCDAMLSDLAKPAGFEVDAFSVPRIAARALLRICPVPWPAQPLGRAPHVLVLGTGELALEIVAHAARLLVASERPEDCVRVTVAGRAVSALAERCRVRYPALVTVDGDARADSALFPLASVVFRECDETSLSPALWGEWQRAGAPFDAVFVATEEDHRSLLAGWHLAALREVEPVGRTARLPITVCLQSRHTEHIKAPLDLHLFEVNTHLFASGDHYPGERQDLGAILVWNAHPGVPLGPPDSQSYRWSGRMAMDHLDVKLEWLLHRLDDESFRKRVVRWRASVWCVDDAIDASAGCAEGESLSSVLQELLCDSVLVDELSRIEHRRFVVERLVEGWLALPARATGPRASGLPLAQQKLHLKVNPTLVAFDALEEKDREVDRKMVRSMPELVTVPWRPNHNSELSP